MSKRSTHELSWFVEDFEKTWYDQHGQFEILNLDNEKLLRILSSDQLNIKNEKIVWTVIRDWVSFDESRLKYMLDLIRDCLRFGRLPTGFIEDSIFDSKHFLNLHNEDKIDLKAFIDNVLNGKSSKEAITDGFNLPYSPTISYFRPRETKSLLICFSNFVEYFDYQLNSWHPSSFELPTKQTSYQLELIGDNRSVLYVFGGKDEEGNATSQVWSRDLCCQSQWIPMTPMSECRKNFSSVVLNGFIYALGGNFTGENFKTIVLSSCERYDSQRNVWETVAPLNTARYDASATVYNGCIYIAGGKNKKSKIKRTVEKYDPQLNKWTLVAPMSNSRCGFSLTTFEKNLWAIGGHNDRKSLSSVESYSWNRNRWQPKTPLSESRLYHAAIDFENELFVAGGCRNVGRNENSDLDVSEPVQVVEKYEPGEGWCQSSCTLKKTHHCAKMIIVSKANSTLFTSRSNQESLKRDAQENSFKSYQSKKMVNDEYLDMHTSSFCTEAGCPEQTVEKNSLDENSVKNSKLFGFGFCLALLIFLGVLASIIMLVMFTVPDWPTPLFPAKDGPHSKHFLVIVDRKDSGVEFYDYQRNVWNFSSFELPFGQTNFQLEQLGSKTFVFGGLDEKRNPTNQMWSRDLSKRSSNWTAMTPMNQSRTDFSSVLFNGDIYACGGWCKDDFLSSCERYDRRQNVWRPIASMNTARFQASAAVHDGFIFIAGGQHKHQQKSLVKYITLQSVMKYDPKSNGWSEVSPMTTARFGFALTPFAGRLWAIGGIDGYGNELSNVESYDPVSDTWREEAQLNEARSHPAAIDFNGQLYVVGDSFTEEKYVPDRGWIKNGQLQKNYVNPKLFVVLKAYSKTFN